MGEQFSINGGTSASAPIFASLITAVDDARIAVGKKPVGWINPAVRVLVHLLLPVQRLIFDLLQLYSSSFVDSFNDVTNGTNPGCGTEGFTAVRGWEPVTGLGCVTPSFCCIPFPAGILVHC